MYQKPFLKWVGGKTQIIDKVMNKFPSEMNDYHEIFLGGGSILLALLNKYQNKEISIRGNIYAYDYNETLINLFKNLRDNHSTLITKLIEIQDIYNNIPTLKGRDKGKDETKESFYYWIRDKFNKSKESVDKSVMFLFLNKTCFRGLYRVGPNGFNVPFGHYKQNLKFPIKDLYNIKELIKNVIFIHSDFNKSIVNVKKGDFVYLDPPYAPESDKSFVSYTESKFNEYTHMNLFKLTKSLKCKFVMSNSCVKMILDNFKDYEIEKVIARRSINSKVPNSRTTEVIIFK